MTFETFHSSYERVFGKKRFGRNASCAVRNVRMVVNKPKSKRKKKELCLHCATKNFIRESEYSGQCLKCGYGG